MEPDRPAVLPRTGFGILPVRPPTWVVVGLTIVVIGAFLFTSANANSTRKRLHTVTYRVTGSASLADVTYRDPCCGADEGVNLSSHTLNVSVPWTANFQALKGELLSVSAHARGTGAVTCRILVDGVEQKSVEHDRGPMCTASGWLSASR